MSLTLLAAVLLGTACVVVGLVVPGMRALSVAGGTLLVFVAALVVWLMVFGLGFLGVVDGGGWRDAGSGSGFRGSRAGAAAAAGCRVSALLRLPGPARVDDVDPEP